jgi:methylenetetrahydrofolate reductase (NADPH)
MIVCGLEQMCNAKDKRAEGKKIYVEIIQQVHEIDGVVGIHMMAYKQEEAGAEILDEVGLPLNPTITENLDFQHN